MTLTTRSVDADSDLVDLLQDDGKPTVTRSATTRSPSKSKQQKYSNYYNLNTCSPSSSNILCRIPELLCFYSAYFILNNPFLGKIAVVSSIAILLFFLVNLGAFGFGSTQEIGVIKYDFSKIHSQYDFDIGKIDHWCVAGGNNCQCPDPLHASPKLHKSWHSAVKRHADMIAVNHDVDIVFLGQTITEAMNGRINGHDMGKSDYFAHVKKVFQTLFSGSGGTATDDQVKAMAMGLTGDTASNVLWRLMNGELPDDFNPPIWWLVLGMEEVGRYGCSEEITVMGILRIVEEIKNRRPDAKIVVNSLLPMIKMRMKEAEDEEEFVDAERENGKGPKPKGEKQHRKRDHAERRLGDTGKGKDKDKDKDKDKQDGQKDKSKNNGLEAKAGKKVAKSEEKKERKREHSKEATRKKYEKAVKKDKYNPHMKDVKKYKKKHNRPDSIPMWSAVHEINKALHNFCKSTPHVTFFDSTSIFAAEGDRGDHVLLTELISPRGHPTAKGFKVWLGAVKKQAEEWKKKMVHAKEQHADDVSYQWFLNDAYYYAELDEEQTAWYPREDTNAQGEEHGESNIEVDEKIATKNADEDYFDSE